MTLILGVDPGASTGLVLVDLPRFPLLDGGRIVKHTVVRRPGKSKKNPTEAARDVAFFWLLEGSVYDWPDAAVTVIERPADQTGFGKLQARGTAFALGSAYAIVLCALTYPETEIVSYPVLDFHGEPGWMQGRGASARRREQTLAYVQQMLASQTLKATDLLVDWTEHELMALCLIAFHCSREAVNTPRRIGRTV